MPNRKQKGFRRRKRYSEANISPIHSNRQSKRKKWSDEQMSGALNVVTRGELKPSEAVNKFGVPRQTLRDRLTGRVVHGTSPVPKPYLTEQNEKILADHLIFTARIGYGKTQSQVMDLVERISLEMRTR